MDEKPGMKAQSVTPQNLGQIAIVAGIFIVLGVLLAHFEPGSISGFVGLALTFFIYLIPTIVAVIDSRAAQAAQRMSLMA